MTHHTFHLHFWQVKVWSKMNNRQSVQNKKKRVKNLRDISMSFRDSSNSLATIIAGHLKIATTVKNRRLNDNWAIA